jgi:hypothetical protein
MSNPFVGKAGQEYILLVLTSEAEAEALHFTFGSLKCVEMRRNIIFAKQDLARFSIPYEWSRLPKG